MRAMRLVLANSRQHQNGEQGDERTKHKKKETKKKRKKKKKKKKKKKLVNQMGVGCKNKNKNEVVEKRTSRICKGKTVEEDEEEEDTMKKTRRRRGRWRKLNSSRGELCLNPITSAAFYF